MSDFYLITPLPYATLMTRVAHAQKSVTTLPKKKYGFGALTGTFGYQQKIFLGKTTVLLTLSLGISKTINPYIFQVIIQHFMCIQLIYLPVY